MATRAISFVKVDDLTDDLIEGRHEFSADVFSIRLSPTVLAASIASNAAITQVTGTNYTAGGILLAATVSGTKPVRTLQSAVDLKWLEDATGFADAATAYIYNDTKGRVLAISDIRDAGNGNAVVDSTGQDVDINLENGTDILTIS